MTRRVARTATPIANESENIEKPFAWLEASKISDRYVFARATLPLRRPHKQRDTKA